MSRGMMKCSTLNFPDFRRNFRSEQSMIDCISSLTLLNVPLLCLQIGNLQAMAQFLSNASKSLSGTLADILSPARMIIFGTLLTTINKPMFAASGYVFARFGTITCLYWVTFAKVFDRMSKGVRAAPGKALIGELAAESGDKTEAAFGM